MKRRFGAAFGATLSFFLTQAQAPAPQTATLTVKVENVSPKGGDMRVALYTQATWDDDKSTPVATGVVPAVTPETTIVLQSIAPGTYGLKAFQDFNRNGEFDFNFLHLPAEKYAFSNDARPLFNDPAFDRAKFTLHAGDNTITIHMQ
ncbi:MAG TPA: DUF2141 domain-containing protein [Rhizomicrobium sp.]|nr:DUF2141 domain-containing protein [Rhizomicrobium sp.]